MRTIQPAIRREPCGQDGQSTYTMHSNLTIGNAAADSRDFRQWFVGDIESWIGPGPGGVDVARFGLRNSKVVELKWGVHPSGETRKGGWASRSEKTALSILIQGRFVVRFREAADPDIIESVCLADQGDYVLWSECLEHCWLAEEDSTVLTVRWMFPT